MLKSTKLLLSVSFGTISPSYDLLILPDVIFQPKVSFYGVGPGFGMGIGWWRWRIYINFYLQKYPKLYEPKIEEFQF
jgi:hypothetical protein